MGGGSHVCNCGYVTAESAASHGVATAVCKHSLERARDRGFRAMQFNFAVSTSARAVRLWQLLDSAVWAGCRGRSCHPVHGYVVL